MKPPIKWFEDLNKEDTSVAGGKGANLGEMIRAGLPVPPGFVITSAAFQSFIEDAGLHSEIEQRLGTLDVNDHDTLEAAASDIQKRIRGSHMPATVRSSMIEAYRQLSKRDGATDAAVAVRSSATMEDTKEASFAGMNRSFLNVIGDEALESSVIEVWASLYSPRVIFYRKNKQLPGEPEIAVIVQKMVNAEKSGVAFTIDPATGDQNTIVIEAALGLGEVVVSGQVEPDHYEVDKSSLRLKKAHIGYQRFMLTRGEDRRNIRVDLPAPKADSRVLSDAEIRAVAELVRKDEEHYGTAQDTEWAFEQGLLYLVQSRPVTTGIDSENQSQSDSTNVLNVLVTGLPASPGRRAGRVRVLLTPSEGASLEEGDILVSVMTTPDWVPFMRRAAAIVTDSGGMTSHAAIISRELGLPCIVGARNATQVLSDNLTVTVDGGAGVVYEGEIAESPQGASRAQTNGLTAPGRIVTATKLMVNLGEPDRAQDVAQMNVDGVGLLRAEFMLLTALDGVHPRRLIAEGRSEEFVDRMTSQLQIFADAFYPRPVIYRSTDFRTNEFRGLAGGEEFEPVEENPMIGLRGAYRYVKDPEMFKLELEVLRLIRETRPNIHLMIPFVRAEPELRVCLQYVAESGLRDKRDFTIWIMAEVPSVLYALDAYAALGIYGVSIGSNDLTQLMLGIDRDSEPLSPLFDERDPAVLSAIRRIVFECRRLGLHSSICGQAPSVHPEYAAELVRAGIDSISVTPDAVESTRYNIAAAEQLLMLESHRAKFIER